MNLPADVDYVPVATAVTSGETTYVPTMCNFQINLQPTYTPHKLRKRFDLQRFTTGKNYKDGSFEVLGRFDTAEIRGCNLIAV